jgi:nifR3 family TIM-barrel protein
MPLKLGTLTLPSLVIQSPLAACSDLPFRLIAREHGLGFSFLEMVSAEALVRKSSKTLDLLKTAPGDRPLGAQLLGSNPAVMAEAAQIIEELGFDLLDLNFGCPVRKVVSNCEGSALLKDPDKAEAVFCAARKALKKIPLTVKTRKGFNDPSGDEAVAIAKRAEAQGLAAITIHGRTQSQQYSGYSDYEAIAKVKAAVKIPVIGNGDVTTPEQARKLFEISRCDAVMLGRAGLGNPWVYRRIDAALSGRPEPPTPTLLERKNALLKHLDLEVLYLGERQAALNLRRIVTWYTAGLPGGKTLRVETCQTMDVRLIREKIALFFDAIPEGAESAPAVPLLLTEPAPAA